MVQYDGKVVKLKAVCKSAAAVENEVMSSKCASQTYILTQYDVSTLFKPKALRKLNS